MADSRDAARYYAVHRGKGSGVYGSWEDAKPAVEGAEGARHRAFDSLWEANFFVTHGREPTFEERQAAVDEAHRKTGEMSGVDVVFCAKPAERVVEWWDTASKSLLKTTPFIAGVDTTANQEVVAACRLLGQWATEAPLPSDTREIQLAFTRASAFNVMTRHMRAWQRNGWKNSRGQPVAIAGELEAACDASDSQRLPCVVHYRVAKLK